MRFWISNLHQRFYASICNLREIAEMIADLASRSVQSYGCVTPATLARIIEALSKVFDLNKICVSSIDRVEETVTMRFGNIVVELSPRYVCICRKVELSSDERKIVARSTNVYSSLVNASPRALSSLPIIATYARYGAIPIASNVIAIPLEDDAWIEAYVYDGGRVDAYLCVARMGEVERR